MKTNIQNAINQQINQEQSAAYIYLGMSAYFESENLTGFASWCRAQYEEEIAHSMRLFQYLLDRDGQVILDTIKAPRMHFDSPLHVFQVALKQEQDNTKSIDKMYELASKENDHATISHLQWFVDEQVEEEKNVSECLALIERAGDDANAILYLNDKFGERTAADVE